MPQLSCWLTFIKEFEYEKAESDRYKTAFITRKGCHRFTVMHFGLTAAPSVFQRLIDYVLCGPI